ncbi:MAG: YkgJ family cysteine cluster protein [Betaproteobacteria bacterium]|nr:MAG: YkgJ family cysteine cluster protein [Betaproteobacteria bacterium]
MICRSGCGACCTAPSISSAIPGMPNGKPAGVRCAQLTDDNRCAIFGDPARPLVCVSLRASVEMCGTDENVSATQVHAMRFLSQMEIATRG